MILVLGEALIDLVPVPGRDGLYEASPGGGPFNTAVSLGRLGVPTAFGGSLSTDAFGRRLRARLVDAGVDLALAATVDAPTPLAVVSPGGAGHENQYSFHLSRSALEVLGPAFTEPLPPVGALHVGTLGTTVEPGASAVEDVVRREHEHVLVAFDPNVRPLLVPDRATFTARVDRLVALADVVKASDADLAWLSEGRERDLVDRWLASGAALVVVTHGAGGAEAWGPAGHVAVPGVSVPVVDTVGAGDAFNGGLFAWLDANDRLTKAGVRSMGLAEVEAALRFAVLVAARTCARTGAEPPWRDELPEGPDE